MSHRKSLHEGSSSPLAHVCAHVWVAVNMLARCAGLGALVDAGVAADEQHVRFGRGAPWLVSTGRYPAKPGAKIS